MKDLIETVFDIVKDLLGVLFIAIIISIPLSFIIYWLGNILKIFGVFDK